MAKKRPAAVTVMGILNIIFGSLGLLAILCLGTCFGVVGAVDVERDMPGGINPLKLMWSYPEIKNYFIVSGVIGLITGTILLVSGIGLLRMRNWARIASIGYAVFTILFQLASFYYSIAHLNPAMERWEKDYNERVREWAQQRGGGVPPQQPSNPMLNMAGGIVGTIIGMGYAVVLLIVMLLPKVSAAFTGRGAVEEPWERRDEDYYDEGYERRRREPDQ